MKFLSVLFRAVETNISMVTLLDELYQQQASSPVTSSMLSCNRCPNLLLCRCLKLRQTWPVSFVHRDEKMLFKRTYP